MEKKYRRMRILSIIGNKRIINLIMDENIPLEILAEAGKTLEILETYYNYNRIPYQSGGYVVIFEPGEDRIRNKLLEIYGVTVELAEFDEQIKTNDGFCWHQQYFQLSTEYGITLFFCDPIEEEDA